MVLSGNQKKELLVLPLVQKTLLSILGENVSIVTEDIPFLMKNKVLYTLGEHLPMGEELAVIMLFCQLLGQTLYH